jgi:hypothetical protein
VTSRPLRTIFFTFSLSLLLSCSLALLLCGDVTRAIFLLVLFLLVDSDLLPYLQKIDQVEGAVGNLEESVRMLDEYTGRLDAQLGQLSSELRQKR